MAADVLEALGAVRGLEGVIVVSAESLPVGTAGIEGGGSAPVEVVHDPVEAGQSAAAARGVRAAVARGAQRVLLVPGDCPALDADEVSRCSARPRPAS